MYKVHVINSLIAPKVITHNLYSAAVTVAPLWQKVPAGQSGSAASPTSTLNSSTVIIKCSLTYLVYNRFKMNKQAAAESL